MEIDQFMARSQSVITDLDLVIRITEDASSLVDGWVETFKQLHVHVEVNPQVKNATLLINSSDLIALTGYISAEDARSISGRRFFKRSKTALEQALLRSVSTDRRAHYTWCITALKALTPGRHLHD